MRLESLTKIIVLGSAVLAELVHATLATQHPFLGLGISCLAFTGTFLVARRFPLLALTPLLLALYLLRGTFFLVFHHFSFFHFLPVSAGLLGLFCAGPHIDKWGFPAPWKFPLVLWGLMLALSWPTLLLRELDYDLVTAFDAVHFQGTQVIPKKFSALWVVHAAMIQSLGLLWLDWLFRTFRDKPKEQFIQRVLGPLAVSFLATSLIAFYQAFFDITFMTTLDWADLRRAGGALINANALGTLAAMWGPALFAILFSMKFQGHEILALLALAVSWLCTLIAGSTSVLLIIGTTLYALYKVARAVVRKVTPYTRLIWGLVSSGIMGGLVVASLFSPTHTPFSRMKQLLPASSELSAKTVVTSQLRDRPFFALLAFEITTVHPLVGTGVGNFHTKAHKHTHHYTGDDPHVLFCGFNCCSLNWYLEQLAELGLLGLLAWGLWLIIFIRTLILASPPDSANPSSMLLKAILLGFGLASLFNIPSEIPEVLLTFWTFVFWLSLYFPELREPGGGEAHAQRYSETQWGSLIGLGILYAVLQVYMG